MKQLVARAIILSRTDYGEADRIITLLTPDSGKLRLMARGVRRAKSKLAGGIELFSISDITYLNGKTGLGTLISSRLDRYYGQIVTDITRVQLGYELIKLLHTVTEDEPESDYFDLLHQAYIALDQPAISTDLIKFWFNVQLLRLAGNTPNLQTDSNGDALQVGQSYTFNFEAVSFDAQQGSRFVANHIKLLRLAFVGHQPASLNQIQSVDTLLPQLMPLVQTMIATYVQR